jgi:hypothetical protein
MLRIFEEGVFNNLVGPKTEDVVRECNTFCGEQLQVYIPRQVSVER